MTTLNMRSAVSKTFLFSLAYERSNLRGLGLVGGLVDTLIFCVYIGFISPVPTKIDRVLTFTVLPGVGPVLPRCRPTFQAGIWD